ncbi:MAG: ATP-binding protein [Chromatiales bacterium]|nr:ATP-binding protein [Chromatiales bacterium]
MAERLLEQKAHATPTKRFFIDMITRDIGLQDCIFDLIDNSLDGAINGGARRTDDSGTKKFEGYWCRLTISGDKFEITDNCGGISLADAVDYAFHFGRPPKKPEDSTSGPHIGLYGIGMKRALFKMGKSILVKSHADHSFKVRIDVDEWAQKSDWDFDLDPIETSATKGTEISVEALRSGPKGEFADPVFINQLISDIAKYYSFFLLDGFEIKVNERPIKPYSFRMSKSDDIVPRNERYEDSNGLSVWITAGLAGELQDEDSDSTDPERALWGWYVLCNDRVVLAGDKTEKTGWGTGTGSDKFPAWHTQYNGFLGIVRFYSDDSNNLPWTTTKRDLDPTNQSYRQALVRMKAVAREFIYYTNARKAVLAQAKEAEQRAALVSVRELPLSSKIELPKFPSAPRIEYGNVAYTLAKSRIIRLAKALNMPGATYKAVGIATFEYVEQNEVGDDE